MQCISTLSAYDYVKPYVIVAKHDEMVAIDSSIRESRDQRHMQYVNNLFEVAYSGPSES